MKSIKQSRTLSFIAVITVYIIAALAGIAVYRALSYPWWLSLLIADVGSTVITFIFSIIFNNASVYDPYWSVQPIVIVAAFAIGTEITPLRALLFIAVCFWGLRLTANWAYTFHGLEHQDWRYTMLKEKTGVFYPVINFLGIHLVPTLIVYGCTLPAVYAFVNDGELTLAGTVFICLSFGAVILQAISDIQMQHYRKEKNTPFIRAGLWKHSRHPNYLGEILMWWGVALCVISSFNDALYLALGALSNTVLFLTVSIPMADGRQSQKTGFDEYKKQTRKLLPIKKVR